jgi:glutamate synthase (NADPH) large chain
MTGGVVVVLGITGRNFGAGMSGGLAFVLDEDGAFRSRCNKGMIEIEELAEADDALLRELVTEHAERTGSARAHELLADWPLRSRRFRKVVPTEYKRVLEEQKRVAVASGESARHLTLVKG